MNLKVRIKNPIFWVQIMLAFLAPILAYFNITAADITSWAKLGELILNALSNPFICFTIAQSIWSALNDPTTSGITDSANAMKYSVPNSDKK